MRPLKLTMQAFGSYSGLQEIDFEKFRKDSIFLITGPTGSGKSTIFDAICYALYNAASGDNRTVKMLRSKAAEDTDKTFVELRFKYHDKEYTVRRNMEYSRKSMRGDGLVTEAASATLTMPDGRFISNPKEVDAELKEIMGISLDQYAKIAMLAQGEFSKVLNDDTPHRTEILRKLFGTEMYEIFQRRIVFEFKKSEEERKSYQEKFDLYQREIKIDETNESALEKYDEIKLLQEKVPVFLKDYIESESSIIGKMNNEISLANSSLALINQKLGKAESIQKTKLDLEKAKTSLPLEEEELNNATKEKEEKEKAKDEINELNIKISELIKSLPKYQELQSLSDKIDKDNLALTKARKDKINFTNLKEQIENQLLKAKEDSKTLTEDKVVLERLKNTYRDCLDKKSDFQSQKKAMESYESLNLRFLEEKDNYLQKSNVAKEKQDTYNALNNAYLDAQAGILAQDLEDGIACPVCGSTHHPVKARLSKDVPTKEELEKSKLELDEAEKERVKASEIASLIEGQAGEKYSSILDKFLKMFPGVPFQEFFPTIDGLIGEYTLLGNKTKLEIEEMEKKISLEEKIFALIPSLETNLNANIDKIAQANDIIARSETSLEETTNQKIILAKELRFDSKADAENHKKTLEDRLSLLKTAIDNAIAKFNLAKENYNARLTSIKTLTDQLEKVEVLDVETIKAEKEDKDKEIKLMQDALSEIQSRVNTNITTLSNIERTITPLEEAKKKYIMLKSLSDTANGNVNGTERIKLEAFVQAAYFKNIIIRANVRLLKMTNGQFELLHSHEFTGRAQGGLDLSILDHYNGKEREVKSLSGGETFIASLALALGLSDEIQANSGGIRLDSMFVDEGFGSLDDASLSIAIKTLLEISESNRLIGIISHVAELKDKILQQIVVTKKADGGSKAEIIVN